MHFLYCYRKRLARELTPALLMDAPSTPSFNTILVAPQEYYSELTDIGWTTLHHLPSSLKSFIKRGQTLSQSLLAAPTWKSPNFHLQFVSHLWCIFHRCSFFSFQFLQCLFSTCSENFLWLEKLSWYWGKFNLLLLFFFPLGLLFFLADGWWNNIPNKYKAPLSVTDKFSIVPF